MVTDESQKIGAASSTFHSAGISKCLHSSGWLMVLWPNNVLTMA